MANIIKRPSIRNKLNLYLNKFKVNSLEKLSHKNSISLFIDIIDDFKKGIISLDTLSSLGCEIFNKIGKKNPKSEIFQVSLSASELSFSTRTPENFKNTYIFLTEIETFYVKYKH